MVVLGAGGWLPAGATVMASAGTAPAFDAVSPSLGNNQTTPPATVEPATCYAGTTRFQGRHAVEIFYGGILRPDNEKNKGLK